jgi:putative addiction module antidote
MVRKLFKTGNSVVVALPRETLDALNLREGSEVSVQVDAERRHIVVVPAHQLTQGVDEAFARQVAEFIEQYRPALEALARA